MNNPYASFDEYGLRHLAHYLARTARFDALRKILFAYKWLQTKLTRIDINALMADYELLSEDKEIRLIRDALHFSAHVLIDNKTELAGQLVGRLLLNETTNLKALLEQIKQSEASPWLRPLIPSLSPAGGPLLHILAGHGRRVGAVAISADKRRALTADDTDIKVWDLVSGRETGTLPGDGRALTALAISLDGDHAISGSEDGMLKIWNIGREIELGTWYTFGHTIRGILLSPDGNYFACIWKDSKVLQIRNVGNGEMKHELIADAEIMTMAFSTNGQNIIAGSWKSLMIWDLTSGEELKTFAKPAELELPPFSSHVNDFVAEVAEMIPPPFRDKIKSEAPDPDAYLLMPDGHRLVLTSGDLIEVWDLEVGQKLHSFQTDFYRMSVLARLDGRRILVCGKLVRGPQEAAMQVCDIEDVTEQPHLTGHIEEIRAIAVTPDARYAISGSDDHTARVWDLGADPKLSRVIGHAGDVWWVDVGLDGKYAVAALAEGSVHVWDLFEGKLVHSLKGTGASVFRVIVTRDNRHIISGSMDGVIQAWDLKTGQEEWAVRTHETPSSKTAFFGTDDTIFIHPKEPGGNITAMTATQDNHYVVCGSESGTLMIIDLKTKKLQSSKVHRRRIQEIAVTPDSRHAITASDDGLLKVWDLRDGGLVKILEGHPSGVSAVNVTPEGERIVSGCWDGSIIVWDLRSGIPIHTLKEHTDEITAIAIFPDNKNAISASGDHTLKVWNLDTGVELFTLKGHKSAVATVKLTPEGRRAISVSNDHTVKVWDLDQRQIIASFTGEDFLTVGALSPDGTKIIAGGPGYVYILELVEGHASDVPQLFSGSTDRVTESPAAKKRKYSGPQSYRPEICKRCGGEIRKGSITCRECGNTDWGVLVIGALLGLLFVGLAIWFTPAAELPTVRAILVVAKWGLGCLGGVILFTMLWLFLATLVERRKRVKREKS